MDSSGLVRAEGPSEGEKTRLSQYKANGFEWKGNLREQCLNRVKDSRQLLVDRLRGISLGQEEDDEGQFVGHTSSSTCPQSMESMLSNDSPTEPIDIMMAFDSTNCLLAEMTANEEDFWGPVARNTLDPRFWDYATPGIMCPYCKISLMTSVGKLLQCCCGFELVTALPVPQIKSNILQTVNQHNFVCHPSFLQYSLFKSSIVLICDSCRLRSAVS